MKDRYEKMYNIKIYKKPKKPKSILARIAFIHHYIENGNIYNFKEGDYIVVQCDKSISLLHIARYHCNETFWLSEKYYKHHYHYRNIHPSVIKFYYNYSVYDQVTDKFYYQGKEGFAKCKYRKEIPSYFHTLQVIPKEKVNNDSVKLFFKFYRMNLK